jgi:pimeloyl-ACP methyl ester carboxylesterase
VPLLRAGRTVTAKGQRQLLFGDTADPGDVQATRSMVGSMKLSALGAYYSALARHDEVASLAELADVPTHVLVGEHDRLTPVSHSRRLHELLPDAELVVLPGKGHMLGFEAPEVITEHLCSLVEGAA